MFDMNHDGRIDYVELSCCLIADDYPTPTRAWTKTVPETTMRHDPVQRRDWRAVHSVNAEDIDSLAQSGLAVKQPPNPPPVGAAPFSELLDKLEQKRSGAGARLYRYLDLNKNGIVDAKELAEGIATIGMGKHDIARLMRGLGQHLGGGSTISLKQFADFLQGPPETYRHRFDPTLYKVHAPQHSTGPPTPPMGCCCCCWWCCPLAVRRPQTDEAMACALWAGPRVQPAAGPGAAGHWRRSEPVRRGVRDGPGGG